MGNKLPTSEIVYFCQMIVVYVIIVTSIVNLSLQNDKREHLITLLCSTIGYLLPLTSYGPLTQPLAENLEDIRKRTDVEMSRSRYFPFNCVPVNYSGKSNFKTKQFTPLEEIAYY